MAAGRQSIAGVARQSIASVARQPRQSIARVARQSIAFAPTASDFARRLRQKTQNLQNGIQEGSSASFCSKLVQLTLLIGVPWGRGLKTLAYKWADGNSICGAPPALTNFLAGLITVLVVASILLVRKGPSCFMKLCCRKRILLYAIPGLCQGVADYFITVSLSLLDVSLFMVICQVEIVFSLILNTLVWRKCPDVIITIAAVMVCVLASAFSMIRSCDSEAAGLFDINGVLFLNIALLCYATGSASLDWLAKRTAKHAEDKPEVDANSDEEVDSADETHLETGLVANMQSVLMLQAWCVPCSLVIFVCVEAGLLVQHGIDACINASLMFGAAIPVAANTAIFTVSVMVCGDLPVQLAAAMTALITSVGNALIFGAPLEAVPLLILVGLSLSNVLTAVSFAKMAEFGREAKLAVIAKLQDEINTLQAQARSKPAWAESAKNHEAKTRTSQGSDDLSSVLPMPVLEEFDEDDDDDDAY